MTNLLTTKIICLIACHGGPADHFAVFAKQLEENGYQVQIFASGPALKKFQDHEIAVSSFSIDNLSPEQQAALADQIAEKCSAASAVLTDVGHSFDITLQKALSSRAPQVLRLAYYDNPESYVPGGYSTVAAQVMKAAQKVLFANANLAQSPLYEQPSQEVPLPLNSRIGLGYYPLSKAEEIADKRKKQHHESDQKLLVYFGGNNEEYFTKAFPAFLQILSGSIKLSDLSNITILLQQHPGAKDKDRDWKLMQQWMKQHGQASTAPKIVLSTSSSDDAQAVADGALYYQTSMGPQFVLAGIPVIQVGHEIYQDLLIRNHLCPSVTDPVTFLDCIAKLDQATKQQKKAILQGLGIRSDWSKILIRAISPS